MSQGLELSTATTPMKSRSASPARWSEYNVAFTWLSQYRGASSRLRLRFEGSRTPPRRAVANSSPASTSNCGSAISTSGPRTMSSCSATPCCWPAGRAQRRPMRGGSGQCARSLRALLSVLPVRGLGRQDRRRGAGRRHVRHARRGVMARRAASLALVGAGKMGAALLGGWLAAGIDRPATSPSSSPSPPRRSTVSRRKRAFRSMPRQNPRQTVVLAIKPQMLDEAAPGARALVRRRQPADFHSRGQDHRQSRRPPAGPAHRARHAQYARGDRRAGSPAPSPTPHVTPAQRESGALPARRRRRGRMGRLANADRRRHRGFRLRPGLCLPAGRGFGPRPARRSACRPTSPCAWRGPPSKARANCCTARPNVSAATLRKNVTSPGGTTQAALDVLMAPDGLAALMARATAAAARRAGELSG